MKQPALMLLAATTCLTTAQAQLVYNYDFSASDLEWTADGDWAWNEANAAWEAPWHGVSTITTLTSPVMTLSSRGTLNGTVTHTYNFEGGYDGGRFEFQLNGGGWNVIANNLFTTEYQYNGTVTQGDYGQQINGWTFTGSSDVPVTTPFVFGIGGESDGYGSGGVPYTFEAGDEVQFRFLSSWGDGDGPSGINWSIASATFSMTSVPEPASTATVAGIALLGFGLWRRGKQAKG